MIGLLCLLLALIYYPGRKRFFSIWLLFFLATAGFQLVPVKWITFTPVGISKPYDWILVFTAAVLFFKPKQFLESPVWKYFQLFMLFGLWLIILLCYSIFIREIEVSVTVRVFRNFIIFIVLFLFVSLELQEIRKIFAWIIYATSVASLLYCLQPFLHMSFLNRITSDMAERESLMATRFYNVPVFVYPVVFFLFYSKQVFDIRFRKILLGINLMAILLTQHRNLLLAVGACFFGYLILQNKMKLQHALLYFVLGAAAFIGADALMEKRLSKGVENISALSLNTSEVRFSEIALSDLSTTRFRQLIVAERFQYITRNETSATFGIGLMTDDSKKALPLQFYIGIPDDEGNISQIANVDIAWGSLLLQLGLPGTLLFVLLHLFLLKRFYQRRKDAYMQVGILFLVSLLITSFYGSMIAMPYVVCLVMLFAGYYYQLSQQSADKEKI